jgi:ABC-2 type transport system permease protein
MRSEFVVASKEFKDYLGSRRFMLLFGLLGLLTIIGAVTGINTYNSDLATYNSDLQRVASAASAGGFRINVDMPSILTIFSSYSTYIASFGMLLAISMGFDMISREKEEGTLKILLTHPVFRDQVINGKIIGATTMLTIVLIATFLVIMAIMLFFGIVPGGDDLIRLAAFFVAVLIFLLAYLAIAVMSSTIAKNSSMAILIAIAIVLVGTVVPNISGTIADTVLGEAPQMTIPGTGSSSQSGTGGPFFTIGSGQNATQGTPMQINPAFTDYQNKHNQITSLINVISPSQDFTTISQVINGRMANPNEFSSGGGRTVGVFQRLSGQTVTIWDSLSSVWMNFLALIVMIVIGFGISYARFVRVDVR